MRYNGSVNYKQVYLIKILLKTLHFRGQNHVLDVDSVVLEKLQSKIKVTFTISDRTFVYTFPRVIGNELCSNNSNKCQCRLCCKVVSGSTVLTSLWGKIIIVISVDIGRSKNSD